MKKTIVYLSEISTIDLEGLLRMLRIEDDLCSLTDDELRRVYFDVNDNIELLNICKRLLRSHISDRHISLYSEFEED